MTKGKRRKFFYLLLATFIISAPLLVAYSLGYTFDPAGKDVKKTGGIFIKSKIARLAIFLNGNFSKETSLISGGALLTDIAPGTYLLRLEKSGYAPWFKTVTVTPEIVTELRGVLLIPRPLVLATTTEKEINILKKADDAAAFAIDKKGDLIKKSGAAKEIVAKNVNSFAVFKNDVFFIDKNGFLARLKQDSKIVETMGRPGFYLSAAPVRFLLAPSATLALLDPAGGIFLLDPDDKLVAVGGGGVKISFDSAGKKMLIQKSQSVEVRWLADNIYQPFQKQGTEETILRLDSPIRDTAWFYKDDAHIAIRTDDGIFFAELDGRGGRNTIELVSGRTNELFTDPEIPDSIFFRKKKTWFKIEF